MRLSRSSTNVLPFLPVLVGLVLSTWRFRADDPLGGLAYGEAGLLLMLVVAARLPGQGGTESGTRVPTP